jgi:chemotaxis protein MotB
MDKNQTDQPNLREKILQEALEKIEFPQESDETSDSGDSWLLSYADLMTLLASFFILLTAFANYDEKGFKQNAKEVASHFSKEKFKIEKTKLDKLNDEIDRDPFLKQMTSTSIFNDSLEINFQGSVLFASGGHKLKPSVIPVLDSLIDIIADKDPNYLIIVEGHTDNQPISKKSIFSSNWALSSARASTVVERFEYFGFRPETLRPVGLGSTFPQVPNVDNKGEVIEDNLKINRRVVIKVLSPIDKEKHQKLGLGVFFD